MEKQELLSRCEQSLDFLSSGDSRKCEQCLLHDFDDNYFGEGWLQFGNVDVVVESIWTDKESFAYDKLCIHVCCEDFEGDVLFDSISGENQKRVIDIIVKRIRK